MKIAVEGCCHGELDAIYAHIASLERRHGYTVDVLLICGDFQAVRNHADLLCMAVPAKYRRLGGFYKYYTGEMSAPILTIVIGGNHEASNYMWELYHGGWLAPNIYFLGFAGCVQVNGVRIAGSSGIYKAGDYTRGHYEKLPYDQSAIRSIYHVRQYDVFKLEQLTAPTIFMSHDWPNTIERHGDLGALLRRKPFFRAETETGTLGSPPLLELLQKLRPAWWFSAHLHVRFEALYRHTAVQQNPDEIAIDDLDGDDVDGGDADGGGDGTGGAAVGSAETRFLALDKCLPSRAFLEVLDVPTPDADAGADAARAPGAPRLTFDAEWLAITRALHPFLSTARQPPPLPAPAAARALVAEALAWVRAHVPAGGCPPVDSVQQFRRTAPAEQRGQPCWYTNAQTEALAQLLGVANRVNPVPVGAAPGPVAAPPSPPPREDEPDGASASSVDPGGSGGWSPSRLAE